MQGRSRTRGGSRRRENGREVSTERRRRGGRCFNGRKPRRGGIKWDAYKLVHLTFIRGETVRQPANRNKANMEVDDWRGDGWMKDVEYRTNRGTKVYDAA